MRVSSSMMQEMFRNMQFPIRKEQIIEHARKQNASSDVIEDLQMLPDREYESADSLMRAMETASQQAGGGGGKSQAFGGTGRGGTGGSGGGGSSSGGSSQGFGGRGGE
jgi:uncharacterized membrane protein YgcG